MDNNDGIHLHKDYLREIYTYRFETIADHIYLVHCKVLRKTPKGFVVRGTDGHEHQIYHSARKKYAHLNLEDAKISFIARRKRRVLLLSNQLKYTIASLTHIDDAYKKQKKCQQEIIKQRGQELENRIMSSINE